MRTIRVIVSSILMCCGSLSAVAQYSSGVELSVGTQDRVGYSYSGEYFHPLPLHQFYVVGGVTTFMQPRFDAILFQKVFVGVQIGEYFFIVPKFSYNFYPNHSYYAHTHQPYYDWGLDAGLMIHPSRLIAFGFKLSYDRGPDDTNLEGDHLVDVNSMAIFFRFKINN